MSVGTKEHEHGEPPTRFAIRAEESLTHGSGTIPAVGLRTLIPDPLATREATKTALEVTGIARRVRKMPAEVALAWAVQRRSAVLTTATTPHDIRENFELSTLPEDAMAEVREHIRTNVRFNAVVATGVPGFIPRAG